MGTLLPCCLVPDKLHVQKNICALSWNGPVGRMPNSLSQPEIPSGFQLTDRMQRCLAWQRLFGDSFRSKQTGTRDNSGVWGLPETGRSIALLGSCGAGMTALGEILSDAGFPCIGFDQSVKADSSPVKSSPRLRQNSWQWRQEFASQTALCVASPAVPDNDPLRQEFANAGIPVMALQAALDCVFQNHQQVCVAGTHGKSSTTALLAWILKVANADVSHFIGARYQDSGRSGHFSCEADQHAGRILAVIESCEFQSSFHQLTPSTVVLTGLERDHFDCFPTETAEDDAFRHFLKQLPAAGTVIYNSGCSRSRKLVQQSNVHSMGFEVLHDAAGCEADLSVTSVSQDSSGLTFTVQFDSRKATARLPMFGRHNVANAAAALCAACHHGISLQAAVDALQTYPGLGRRFEFRAPYSGMQMIDDYAHHPTAIRTTLRAASRRFPGRSLRVVFEPHQLVRLEQLHNDFVESLCLADRVDVLPVLAARESATAAECHRASQKLINRLRSRGTSAFFSPNLDHAVQTIEYSCSPNAVLLTMGAGRAHLIHDKLSERLRRYSVA